MAVAFHGLCCNHWGYHVQGNTSCVQKEEKFWCLTVGRAEGTGQTHTRFHRGVCLTQSDVSWLQLSLFFSSISDEFANS